MAGGWFHEVSAYVVSFPFAFGALCLVNKLLNWDQPLLAAPGRPNAAPVPARVIASAAAVPGKTVSYDY